MQKTVRFNSVEVSSPTEKTNGAKAITPLMEQIDEERSGKSVTVSVFSRHQLPEKGYETLIQRTKAYSTLFGGILWMLVSINLADNKFLSFWDPVTQLLQSLHTLHHTMISIQKVLHCYCQLYL